MSQSLYSGVLRGSDQPHFCLRSSSSRLLGFVEVVHLAQVLGQHQDAAVSIQDFGPPVSTLDIFAVADCAVVGQDHYVGLINERQDRVSKACPPGVSYFVIGTSPRNTSTSGSTHCGMGSRATARKRWRREDGSAPRSSRPDDACRFPSEEGPRWNNFFAPAICLPVMSMVEISSGFRKPFECIVGVQSTSFSLITP